MMSGNIRPAVSLIKQGLCNSSGLPFPELLEMNELDGLAQSGPLTFMSDSIPLW
jgi:hypothetical protein